MAEGWRSVCVMDGVWVRGGGVCVCDGWSMGEGWRGVCVRDLEHG